MNLVQFESYCADVLHKVMETMRIANKEYARDEDKFDNFNRIAEQLRRSKHLKNVTNVDVAKVYLLKHIDSLVKGVSIREPIEGRITDCIAYLLLMGGMMFEATSKAAPQPIEENADNYQEMGEHTTENAISPGTIVDMGCFNLSAHAPHLWIHQSNIVACSGIDHAGDYSRATMI